MCRCGGTHSVNAHAPAANRVGTLRRAVDKKSIQGALSHPKSGEMPLTLKSLMRTLVYLMCLFVFYVLGANALVGGNDFKDMVDLARLKCMKEGFAAKDMSATC